jgi:hypothetical protein
MKIKIAYPKSKMAASINAITASPTAAPVGVVNAPNAKTASAPGNTMFKSKKQGLFQKKAQPPMS